MLLYSWDMIPALIIVVFMQRLCNGLISLKYLLISRLLCVSFLAKFVLKRIVRELMQEFDSRGLQFEAFIHSIWNYRSMIQNTILCNCIYYFIEALQGTPIIDYNCVFVWVCVYLSVCTYAFVYICVCVRACVCACDVHLCDVRCILMRAAHLGIQLRCLCLSTVKPS